MTKVKEWQGVRQSSILCTNLLSQQAILLTTRAQLERPYLTSGLQGPVVKRQETSNSEFVVPRPGPGFRRGERASTP